MSAWLGLFRIEARRNMALWLLPVIMVVTWLLIRNDFAMAVLLWTDSSVLVRDTVLLAGPFIAGAGAWMAGREHRSGIEELLATTPFTEPRRRVITWAATSIWAIVAYLLVGIVIVVLTARGTTWGAPILWPMVVGLLALPAYAAMGYALGVFVPSRFTAPIVALAFFVGQLVLGEIALPLGAPAWLVAMSPIARLDNSVFYGVKPDIGLPQSLFLLGMTGVALASFSLRSSPVGNVWACLLASIALAVAGMVMLKDVDTTGDGIGWSSRGKGIPYEPVCQGKVLRICVHPAYQALLRDLTPRLDQMAAPLAGLPGVPTRVEQVPAGGDSGEVMDETIFLTLSPYSWAGNTATHVVAHELVYERGPMTEAQAAVMAWLLGRAGLEIQCDLVEPSFAGSSSFTADQCAAAERFTRLDPAEQRLWLEANYAALREGRMRLEELP